MISSTTLVLATLFFNAASVYGAPIRIPTVPEVVVRAEVDNPILPRVPVVDAKPEPNIPGTGTSPRIAREVEFDTRDTASSVDTRSPLPEVDKIVRRYPRRSLHDFYEKRSHEPSPAPSVTDSPAETRSTPEPEIHRRFPRRIYHDFYSKRSDPVEAEARSEPAPVLEARSEEPVPEVTRRFPRRALAELHTPKRPLSDDKVARQMTPEPAPEPAPSPKAFPTYALLPRFPRREMPPGYYDKRQADGGSSTATPATPTPSDTTLPTPTSTTDATVVATPTVAPGTSLGDAIAAAIVSNALPAGTGTTSKSSLTKVEITISSQMNSDVKPLGPQPDSSTSPSSTAAPASTSSTPDGTGAAPPPAGGSPLAAASPSSPADGTSATTPSDPASPSASPSADPSAGGPPAATAPGDTGDRKSSGPPLARRSGGISGALWASWNRRSVN